MSVRRDLHVTCTWSPQPARGSWSHRLLTESQFVWNLSASLYHVPSNLSIVIFGNVKCITPRTPVTPASRDSRCDIYFCLLQIIFIKLTFLCRSSHLTFSDHLHHFTEYDIFIFSPLIFIGVRGIGEYQYMQVKAERGVNTREWNV